MITEKKKKKKKKKKTKQTNKQTETSYIASPGMRSHAIPKRYCVGATPPFFS